MRSSSKYVHCKRIGVSSLRIYFTLYFATKSNFSMVHWFCRWWHHGTCWLWGEQWQLKPLPPTEDKPSKTVFNKRFADGGGKTLNKGIMWTAAAPKTRHFFPSLVNIKLSKTFKQSRKKLKSKEENQFSAYQKISFFVVLGFFWKLILHFFRWLLFHLFFCFGFSLGWFFLIVSSESEEKIRVARITNIHRARFLSKWL